MPQVSSMKATKEIAFEDAIEDWLLTHGGYARGVKTNYDPVVALDTAELFTFIGATQAEVFEQLVQLRGGDPDVAQRGFVERLVKLIDERARSTSFGTGSRISVSISSSRISGRRPGSTRNSRPTTRPAGSL
jgi:hypothetical protein